jgi:hypothetical protein
MGWDEGAAEVVEITEEERLEFEKQLQQVFFLSLIQTF